MARLICTYRWHALLRSILIASGVLLGVANASAQPGQPTVNLMGPQTVFEGAGSVTVAVFLSSASSQTVTVQYATANGTATSPADYASTNGTLTFAPGETSKPITVSIVNDQITEGDETFTINLSNPQNATIGTGQSTVTIKDGSGGGGGTTYVQFSSPTYSVAEGAGSIAITVTLSASSPSDVTVNYATADGPAPNGASAGADYTATSGTLTIPAGVTSKTFSISILQDTSYEGDETVTLTLSSPSGATLGTPSTATLTITDDEQPPLPTVQFSAANYSVYETAKLATISVTLSASSSSVVMVSYATSDGTATAPADYKSTAGVLQFMPGETSKTFDVEVYWDGLTEGDETVNLTLTDPVLATLGAQASAVLKIVDVNVSVKVKEVSFSGDGFTTVYESFTDQGPYSAPHWLDANDDGDAEDEGERAYPISFTRFTTMELAAKFKTSITPNDAPPPLYLKITATGPTTPDGNLLEIDPSGVQVPFTVPEISLPATAVTKPFQDAIGFYDPLSIEWKYTPVDFVNISSAGKSDNIAYLTLGKPEFAPFAFVLSVGSVNAQGQKDPVKAIDAIFGAFKGAKFEHKVDEKKLLDMGIKTVKIVYYKDWKFKELNDATFHTVAGVLKQGEKEKDTDCLGCCAFFVDVVAKQDATLKPKLKYLSITPVNAFMNDEFIMVQTWQEKAGFVPLPAGNYRYWNVFAKKIVVTDDMQANNKYQWKDAASHNVEDKDGLAGQNQPNPPSIFKIHVVMVQHQDSKIVFDPSYGTSYPDTMNAPAIDAIEAAAIWGYGLIDPTDVQQQKYFMRKRDPNQNGVKFGQFTPPFP